MNKYISLLATWLLSCGLGTVAPAGSVKAQSAAPSWDFAKLGESVSTSQTEVTVKGFALKANQLHDAIIASETAKSLAREEQRRSAGSTAGGTSSSDSGPAAFTVVKRWSGGVRGVREQSYVRCDSGRNRGEEFKAWLHDSGYWSSPGNTVTYKTLQEVMTSVCR